MASEKELNVSLFERLEPIERVLKVLNETGDLEKVREALEYEKELLERKLYQNPPLEK